MTGTGVVKLEQRDSQLWITLNRPAQLNAWDRSLASGLQAALSEAADPSIRVVLIRGAGRGFSSGADLKADTDPTPEGYRDVGRNLKFRFHPVITSIRSLPKPVIAAVHGPAAGIGASLALACDFVIAARSAYFLFAFVRVGLVPDGGASLLAAARVGLSRATELAMLGDRVDAETAAAWGLVNRVVNDELLEQEAEAMAERLEAGPTQAYGGIKAALNRAVLPHLQSVLDGEIALQQVQASSVEFAEGRAAFSEGRSPSFNPADR